MRVAVAGGTGMIGAMVVEEASGSGHDVTVISRSTGIDLMTGQGLEATLDGVDIVVDVLNSNGISKAKSVGFFGTTTANLLTAETAAGVRHHIALSIVGIDRVPSGYYAGKRRQEELIEAGGVPWTILRATQFHEFPAQLLAGMKGPIAVIPRMRSATVAAREVARRLVELLGGPPSGRVPEMSGPQVHELPDLARRLVKARAEHRVVLPLRLPGKAGKAMIHGGQLPLQPGVVGIQTFDKWLVDHVHNAQQTSR